MKNFKIPDLFAGIDMSPEAVKKRQMAMYDRTIENPENMSFWFPKIEVSTTREDSILRVPKTKVIQLPFEWWHWLKNDSYSPEQIQEFNDFLLENLGDFGKDFDLFMKTGVFSNKFVFHSTVIKDTQKIGKQFLDIFYESMLCGADNTSEAVFREMIKDRDNRTTIYKGMPLHTEFRVFYDFDTKEIVGVANYWHPDVMTPHLKGDDALGYQKEIESIVSDFNVFKHRIADEVKSYMAGVTGLQGKWSVDVMKNKEDFWLIDMARMERSALVPQIEQL